MNFSSPEFLLFFLFVFIARWTIGYFEIRIGNSSKIDLKILFLLLSSYGFYSAWDFRFAFLIFITTISDFFCGKRIFSSRGNLKKFILFVSIFIDLGILGVFKYFNFFIENFLVLANAIGLDVSFHLVNIVLPVGISFYTFQSLSYTIDIYRGQVEPEKSFLKYALYLSFFPQLVAGPIVKAKNLLPQLNMVPIKHINEIPLKLALYYVLLGYIKKSVIADNISIIPDIVFANPNIVSYSFISLGIVAYSIQIYCDFSGYSDIAIGIALLLGFYLPENFNMPYFSFGFKDFWSKWHISLSSWLKEYLYISLGGNRFGYWRTYRNLFITMLLGGLWHGANWTFLIWGGGHGLLLGLERAFLNQFSGAQKWLAIPIVRLFYGVFVLFAVCLLWVFFRAENFGIAYSLFEGLFVLRSGVDCNYSLSMQLVYVVFFVILAHIFGLYGKEFINKNLNSRFTFANGLLIAMLIVVAVLLSGDTKPFIYFVF